LKRAIQREIETPLAKRILAGEVRDGQTILVDVNPEGDGLTFRVEAGQEREKEMMATR
jgi:ATP-dependent Clp protease ATP-binding subunit ClpB